MKNALLTVLFAWVAMACSFAGTTLHSTYVDKQDIANNVTLTVRDNSVTEETPSSDYGIIRTNRVRLTYMRTLKKDVSVDFSYQVSYELMKTGTSTVVETGVVSVSFDHDGTSVYEDIQEHTVLNTADAADVTIKVTNITTSGTVPNDIRLELLIATEKYAKINTTKAPLTSYTTSSPTTGKLNWQYMKGAEEYDMEWVFIDAKDNHPAFTGKDAPFKYKTPTSITTAATWQEVDLTFPEGTIYFRVRGVGRHVYGVNGDYTYLDPGVWGYSPGYKINSSFEPAKNWQYQTTFAEEGKSKMVMSYFDGSLRDRQDVTKVSTDNTVIVGEKKYDSEGRAAVSILPVPVSGKNIAYRPLFNVDADLSEFEKSDFEEQVSGGPKALGNTTGAGKYYSASNSFISTDPFAAYTPDAGGASTPSVDDDGGWPYVQTTFKRDATGRPMKVSGVGPDHLINGSGNHETEYYYGTANATELHTMFGTNVGKASHYKKNMVKDANGQYSVSYLDQEGRTIATALAGDNPSNLEPLSSMNTVESFSVTLNDNNVTDAAGHRTVSVSKILNIPSTSYDFSYDMNGVIYLNKIPSNGTTIDICEDCKYKLSITIQDPDGLTVQIQDPVNGAVSTLTRTFSNPASPPDCNDPSYSAGVIDFTTVNPFSKAGEYTVTKILELDVASFADEIHDAVEDAGFGDTYLNTLIQQYKDAVDTTVCDYTCEQHCRTLLKQENPTWTNEQINAEVPTCVASNCNTLANDMINNSMDNECKSLLTQMEMDVRPDGFHYMEPQNGSFWDDIGSKINLFEKEDGTSVTVAYMANPDNFRTEWIPNMVTSHREYCHYTRCTTDVASSAYDKRMTQPANWSDADTKGYLNPLAVTGTGYDITTAGTDPWFASHSSAKTIVEDWMEDVSTFNATYSLAPTPPASTTTLWDYVQQSGNPAYSTEFPWNGINQFKLFRNIYLAMKAHEQEEYYKTQSCSYYTDDNAIMIEQPDVTDPDNTEWHDLFNSNLNQLNDCGSTCEQNVNVWMNQLKDKCSISSHCGLDLQNQIRAELLAYCNESCGLANPLGIITTDVAAGSNAHIVAINNLLASSNNGIDCSTCSTLVDIAIPNPYDCVVHEVTLQKPSVCLTQVINIINNYVYPDFEIPSGNTAYSESNPVTTEMITAGCAATGDYVKVIESTSGISRVTLAGDPEEPPHSDLAFDCLIWELRSTSDPNQVIRNSDIDQIAGVSYHVNRPANFPASTGSGVSSATFANIKFTLSLKAGGTQTAYVYKGDCFNLTTASTETICIPTGFNNTYTFVTVPEVTPDSLHKECMEELMHQAEYNAHVDYNHLINTFSQHYLQNHYAKCFADDLSEDFSYSYDKKEYHYTLYYYDQAGNLTQTVPPAGYVPVPNSSPHFVNGVYNGSSEPAHTLVTKYLYNSINRLVKQETPDAGLAKFWYNEKGQLKASQNAKQSVGGSSRYSYTLYDQRGRITDVGEALFDQSPTLAVLENDASFLALVNDANTQRSQVTRTYYDKVNSTFNSLQSLFSGGGQTNLRSRVANVTVNEGTGTSAYTAATHYSYDIHGNVKELVQDIAALDGVGGTTLPQRYKKVGYEYDLISGKVNAVHYQPGQPDAFHHRYEYDADNRLSNVYTATTPLSGWEGAESGWAKDAKYFYYKHGPLARTEIGQDKVQGIDYSYTLQGWIKGVNSNTLKQDRDMGKDGNSGSTNINTDIARDAFGYTLGYYGTDYSAIGGSSAQSWQAATSGSSFTPSAAMLYNGNISHMVMAMRKSDGTPYTTLGRRFHYDQLNRLVNELAFSNMSGGSDLVIQNNTWSGASNNVDYNESFTYDANGNILTLTRYGTSAQQQSMDELTYNYYSGTNRLAYVDDQVSSTNYTTDIDDQNSGNYTYDEIGNLKSDAQEGISDIAWTVYGKIKSITKTGSGDHLEFKYDAQGNRIAKIAKPSTTLGTPSTWTTTYYLRDAQGNALATYEDKPNDAGFHIMENALYGSSRLGIMRREIDLLNLPSGGEGHYSSTRGKKAFELSNHLGNVLEVVSDQKKGIDDTGSDGIADYYTANVRSATDYYAFGAPMPGRNFNSNGYRYGFNGKEKDNEMYGEGNAYNFEARIQDPRLGRFLSLDPLMTKYPSESPYNFCLNSPIAFKDADGRDAILIVFPDYKIDPEIKVGKWRAPKIPGPGHAGVLIINNKTGKATYYEYGRYKTTDGTKGKVRKYDAGTIVFGKDGKPTESSLNAVMGTISETSGDGGRIQGAYVTSDKFKEMKAYADEKYKESNPGNKEYDKSRDPYDLYENNCGTFAEDCINQDPNVDKPSINVNTPTNIVDEYLEEGNAEVNYDPKTKKTTMGTADESDAKVDGGKSSSSKGSTSGTTTKKKK